MAPTRHPYSLIRRISIWMASIYIVLLILMLINNIITFSVVRKNIYNQLSDSLLAGNRQISAELNNAGVYLATLSISSSNITIAEQNKRDSNYYLALHRIQSELEYGIRSLSNIDGMFVYPTSSQEFISAINSYTTTTTAGFFRDWCRTQDTLGTLDSYVGKYWFSCKIDKDYYLFRILKKGSSYMGVWTNYNDLLSNISIPDSLNASVYFAYDKQNTFSIDSRKMDFSLYPENDEQHVQTLLLDHNYIAINIPTAYTEEGYLYSLVEYGTITNQLLQQYLYFVLSISVFLLLALLATVIILKYLKRPLNQIEFSLIALRDGDFSIRLPADFDSIEFTNINNAFNQMVSRIEELKIDVYEKQLDQQKNQLQALKNQIAPHFLINCLNSIYHMSVANNAKGIQNMTVYLGEHLRYALADVSFVPLHMELEKVSNYIHLSQIRFPDCIALYTDIEFEIKDAMVPPMIFLFQIENIIKYEVINGEITEIHLEAKKEDESLCLHLTVWDTGTGYATDVLRQLEDPARMNQIDGHNIGTRNIFKRLDLMFHGKFKMHFSNRNQAGAQVDIWIPYQQTPKTERIK